MEKYNFHKRLFKIENNKYLDLFENLLLRLENPLLECSVKFDGDKIFPCRYNIYYKGKYPIKNINLVFNFFMNLSNQCIDINYDLLKQTFGQSIDFNKTKGVMVGIDLRKNFDDSRVKFGFAIDRKYADLSNKVLNLHGYNQKVIELLNKNELIFGFDFSFNGKTRIKIYPPFDVSEFQNNILMNKLHNTFSPAICRLISKCHALNISFEKNEFERILHFHTNKLDDFCSLIKNNELNKYIDCIKELYGKCVISLREKEIDKNKINKINKINFYY